MGSTGAFGAFDPYLHKDLRVQRPRLARVAEVAADDGQFEAIRRVADDLTREEKRKRGRHRWWVWVHPRVSVPAEMECSTHP